MSMRKYRRSIARYNMKAAGVRHPNRRSWGLKPGSPIPTRMPSFFAEHWRDYV